MSRTRHHGNKAKKRLFGDSWLWYRTTPSWWINERMTRPQRQETRLLLQSLRNKSREELEDAPLFPLAKKPYEYFW